MTKKSHPQTIKVDELNKHKNKLKNITPSKNNKVSEEKPHLILKYFGVDEEVYYQFEDFTKKIYSLYKLSLFTYKDSNWESVEWNSNEMNEFYDILHFNMTCSTNFLNRAGIRHLKQLTEKDLKKSKIPTLPSRYLRINFP